MPSPLLVSPRASLALCVYADPAVSHRGAAAGVSCPATISPKNGESTMSARGVSADKTSIIVIGAGATGTRAARQIVRTSPSCQVSLIDDAPGVAESAAESLGPNVSFSSPHDVHDVDAVVIATRAGSHESIAQQYLAAANIIVSVADSIEDVRGLLDLDEQARADDCRVVVGAGMMPGLTDVLAAHGRRWFDHIREVHVSKFGTGGPDCARQHHRALKGLCFDWRDDRWQRRPGGSGRELAWFPSPVEAADCYRAALGDPLLLLRAHPTVERITSRMAATRRDRLTMQLPMLRNPHPEGLLGAVRVELRGMKDGAQIELVLGSADRPAVTAGAVAASAVESLLASSDDPGAKGLAEWVEPTKFLHSLRSRGVRSEIFVGADETYQ